MRTRTCIASLVLCISTTIPAATVLAQSAEPSVLWESPTELRNPESVVHDADNDVLYVSNVDGGPMDKDGKGFISKLSPANGSIVELEWVGGLDAPKGLALHDGTLYVADIDRLVEIDISSGSVSAAHAAEGAKFLNDVAVTDDGVVYVSDMITDRIHRLLDGEFTAWLDSAGLENPNGLLVEGDWLVVGSWGKMADDFSTEVPGHLKSVSLDEASVQSLGDGTPVGNLDGVESDGQGNYLVSDWVDGALYRITPEGEATQLLDLDQGSADIGVVDGGNIVLMPMMNGNKVVAYDVSG